MFINLNVQLNEYELKPGGSGVAVTEENRKEYVRLMVEWRLSRGIKRQTDSLRLGLREMLPKEYLDQFDSQELEWVIAGTPEINVEDWKKNTLYWGGVCLWVWHADHVFVLYFIENVSCICTCQSLYLPVMQCLCSTCFRTQGNHSDDPYPHDTSLYAIR